MQYASPHDHESPSPAGATSRGFRWERLGVGVGVGLVLMTALGSAWGMLVGAVAALGVVVVWELLARR